MSDAIIKMILTCVGWAVAYFVVLFITNKAGVGYNVLKNSLKWLVELKKLCVGLRAQLSSKGFTLQSKSAIHGLKKVVRCEKGIARILTVYMFDNKDDKNSIDQTFSAYRDFDATQLLVDVQDQLCQEISEELVDLIFNATLGNW